MINKTIVIVGAGPAGTTMAYKLKKANIDCLLIDKAIFPREKLCGGLVTSKTVRIYERIFNKSFNNYSHKTNAISIYYKKLLISSFNSTSPYWLVQRKDFDTHLLSLYKNICGEIWEGCMINSIDTTKKIIYTNTYDISYEICIGADGANSFVRKFVDSQYSPNGFCLEVDVSTIVTSSSGIQIYFGVAQNGYGWVFPKSECSTVGCGGEKQKNILNKFATYYKNLYNDKAPHPKGAFVPFGKYVKTPYNESLYLIGDAAGLADPITGEGLYFAFKSADILSDAIIKNIKNLNNISIQSSYSKSLQPIKEIIDNASNAKKLLFNPLFQKIAFKLLLGHEKIFIFTLNNIVSEYKILHTKLITTYLQVMKERKQNEKKRL